MLTKTEINELADKVLSSLVEPQIIPGRPWVHNCVETTIERTLVEASKKVPYVTQSILGELERFCNFTEGEPYQSTQITAIKQALKILKQLSVIEPKPYSVLLVYPDYITSNYGQDTYLAHVLAASIGDAVLLARQQARSDRGTDPHDGEFLEDYFVSLVCEGHINDIKE